MIELRIEGCCKNCKYMNLSLRSFGDLKWVKCEHEAVCGKLKEEQEKGADDEAD